MKLSVLEKEVPFDQFSRQFQVSAIFDELRAEDESFKILDVGGYRGRTADFLFKDDVTVLDLYDVKDKHYVKGSALEMPFEDGSFDYVVSFDVLEHIPANMRQKFFDECNRTAKNGVIICAPNKTAANQYAEVSLNELYKKLHKKPHEWLKEHIEYGIPDFDELEKYINKKGLTTTRFHSNKTQLWVVMQEAIFLNSKYPMASEDLVAINDFYNKNFRYDGGGMQEASYRLILCCFHDAQNATKVARKLSTHNMPIDPKLEIALYEKITEFNLALVQKSTNLANDYKKLHEHEMNRATILQKNNETLLSQVAKLDNTFSHKISRRLKSTLAHPKE